MTYCYNHRSEYQLLNPQKVLFFYQASEIDFIYKTAFIIFRLDLTHTEYAEFFKWVSWHDIVSSLNTVCQYAHITVLQSVHINIVCF